LLNMKRPPFHGIRTTRTWNRVYGMNIALVYGWHLLILLLKMDVCNMLKVVINLAKQLLIFWELILKLGTQNYLRK